MHSKKYLDLSRKKKKLSTTLNDQHTKYYYMRLSAICYYSSVATYKIL